MLFSCSLQLTAISDWISLSFRTHLLGIICKKIGSSLFPHHLDEKLDLILNFFIPPNPFAVAIEAYDSWNIAMCLHSFKQFECSGIKSIQRSFPRMETYLELCPTWNSTSSGTLPCMDLFPAGTLP